MKKKVIIVIIAMLVILIPIGIIVGVNLNSDNIRNGKYYVKNCEEYPDAYIEIKAEKIYIHNIDLNALYQEKQLENLRKFVEIYELNYSEEEILLIADLNNTFSVEGYDLSEVAVIKEGTFTYWYPCHVQNTTVGLQITYNSWENTITINNQGYDFIFKK